MNLNSSTGAKVDDYSEGSFVGLKIRVSYCDGASICVDDAAWLAVEACDSEIIELEPPSSADRK